MNPQLLDLIIPLVPDGIIYNGVYSLIINFIVLSTIKHYLTTIIPFPVTTLATAELCRGSEEAAAMLQHLDYADQANLLPPARQENHGKSIGKWWLNIVGF